MENIIIKFWVLIKVSGLTPVENGLGIELSPNWSDLTLSPKCVTKHTHISSFTPYSHHFYYSSPLTSLNSHSLTIHTTLSLSTQLSQLKKKNVIYNFKTLAPSHLETPPSNHQESIFIAPKNPIQASSIIIGYCNVV